MTVTSRTRPRAATIARVFALALGVLLVAALGRVEPVAAIGQPVAFEVVQNPTGPADVTPGQTVAYTVSFTSNELTAVSGLILEGSLGPSLTVTGFSGGLGPTHCAGVGSSAFSCSLGGLGANSSIAPITINATVRNVTSGTVIDREASHFFAKDQPADMGVNPAVDQAGALTVLNEFLMVTTTPSAGSVWEAGVVNYSVTLQNTGNAASDAMTVSLNLTNGTVTNVVCPGGGPGTGSGTANGTCTNVNVTAGSAATGMTVTVKAHNSGNTNLAGVLTVTPAVGNETGLPVGILHNAPAPANVSILEAAISGPSTREVNQQATICTTNAPGLQGHVSGSTTYSAEDFQTVANDGAVISGKALAGGGCPVGQQGIVFTSTAPGTVSVNLMTRAPGTSMDFGLSNTVTVQFGPGAPVATKLAFTSSPTGSVVAGSPLSPQPVVAVQTAGSATVTTDNSTVVTLSVSGGGTLTCTDGNTRQVASGVATFSGCSVTPAGSYTLTASAASLTAAMSGSFTTTAPATKLAFTTQPGDGVANQNLATQPVVAVRTAGDTTVTTDNTTQVTLAISDGATLTCEGGLTKKVTAGVATFAGCKVTPAGTGYTLTATSSPTLTPATSAEFDVTAAPPTTSNQLVVETPASGPVPRSRLTFRVATGTLAPSEVRFIIRRTSDNHYWNASTGAWQSGSVQNTAANAGSGKFTLAVTGDDRRDFVNTSVTVEVRATVGSTTYVNTTVPTIAIR